MSNIKLASVFFAIACVFISSYVLIRYLNVKTEMHPLLPSGAYETERLFKALTNLGPGQQVGVEIMYDGKYSMKTENFSFSYTIQHLSLERYTKALAMESNVVKRKNPVKWNGYFKVLAVGEELSKGMSNFMSLAYLLSPGMAQMKLVAPYYKGGHLHASGVPFDMIYDFDYLNRLLSNNGYSILVKDDEYERACNGETIYIVQDFFPHERKGRGLLTEQVYHEFFEKTGGKDWLECGAAQPEKTKDTKYTICTKNFNLTKLRTTALKNAKCIVMPKWVDHGLIAANMGAYRLHVDQIFRLLIKPNKMLIEEAKLFTDRFLKRPYVAIHIRSAHIRKPPSTVRRCFKLALEFVKALKSTRNVKTVFLSTDTTKYGSVVAGADIEEEFAAMAGAVTYSANATGKLNVIVKTTVSITDVLLMSQSDHLIALGTGSFHGFVLDRFLMHHVKMDPNTWSLIEICKYAR